MDRKESLFIYLHAHAHICGDANGEGHACSDACDRPILFRICLTHHVANYHKPRPRAARRAAQTTTPTPQARECSARLVRGHVRCLCVFCASGQEEYNSAVAPVVYLSYSYIHSRIVVACFALRVASPARRRRRLRAPGARRARARVSHVACARGSAMPRGTRAHGNDPPRPRNPYK